MGVVSRQLTVSGVQTVMSMQINTALLSSYIRQCKTEAAMNAADAAAAEAGSTSGRGTGSVRSGADEGGAASEAGDGDDAAVPATAKVLEAAQALPVQYHFASRIPPSLWDAAIAQFSGAV